jgi:hypothetical protein
MPGMQLSEEEVSRHASESQIVRLKGRTVPGTVRSDDNFITVYTLYADSCMHLFYICTSMTCTDDHLTPLNGGRVYETQRDIVHYIYAYE